MSSNIRWYRKTPSVAFSSLHSILQLATKAVHVYFLRNRKKWLEQAAETQVVLWWIPRGHIPTALEGKEKLRQLEEKGPSLGAFTFQMPFDSAGNPLEA